MQNRKITKLQELPFISDDEQKINASYSIGEGTNGLLMRKHQEISSPSGYTNPSNQPLSVVGGEEGEIAGFKARNNV